MKPALAVGLILGLIAAAPAQGQSRAEAGLRLALQWCTSCHQVEADAPAMDVAPSFITLANERDETFDWVRTRLQNPFYPMAGINLSRAQIDDIIAYFETLRE